MSHSLTFFQPTPWQRLENLDRPILDYLINKVTAVENLIPGKKPPLTGRKSLWPQDLSGKFHYPEHGGRTPFGK